MACASCPALCTGLPSPCHWLRLLWRRLHRNSRPWPLSARTRGSAGRGAYRGVLTGRKSTQRRSRTRTASSTRRTTGAHREGAAMAGGATGGDRSSVSSDMSDDEESSSKRRWTAMDSVGRCMFFLSVVFFIIGVLLTVFGFSNIVPTNKLPLQVIGPACLTVTFVMWALGCVFNRLMNKELRQQQQAIELRDRVQLYALANDILNRPVLSPAMLQDPRIRRQLMCKLRQQKTLDMSSEAPSRRSSRAVSVDSRFDARRRQSSTALLQADIDRRKSLGRDPDDIKGLPFELPGIQISRFETLDGGEGSVAGTITGSGCGSKKYIIIHNDVGSDFSRLSCPSDYSLCGSTSRSRSRSSRASSGVSSRLWDFSPRESEWDADISLGSRDSQLNVSKQDWGGGPSECGDYTASNASIPRRMSVVTFDMSSPLRRHSSPASAGRRKDSGCECTCGKGPNHGPTEYPSVLKNRDNSCHALRYSDEMPLPTSSLRKKSADQSILSVRIDEDERELDVDETTPLRPTEVVSTATASTSTAPAATASTSTDKPCLRNNVSTDSSTGMTASAATDTEQHYCVDRRDSRVLRPPLKRNNTDDSEVERRVAKLFKDIEFSVSDSVDESKINSQEYDSHIRRVEAQTQTMNEAELQRMAESLNIINLVESADQRRDSKASSAKSRVSILRQDSQASFSDNQQASAGSSDLNLVPKEEAHQGPASIKGKEKKSKLHVLSNAIAHLGRRSSSVDSGAVAKEKRLARAKNIPRRLLFHLGLSDDTGLKSADVEAGQGKTAPPTYEDVVNDNL